MKLALAILFFINIVRAKIDLFLGTGGFGFGCGSNSPAVQVPYSYVRLGPDTTPMFRKLYKPFQHFGGYSFADHSIRAFSHMHLVGAGVQDMGILGILPKISKGNLEVPIDPLAQFYKNSEYAEPGYYSSELENKIKV